MRTAFIDTLSKLAAKDPRVTLLVGDLGFGVVDEFAERFPKQFYNVGVAEQNMTGIAAGMALSGRVVFTYSIANFPTLRPLEQIRNDVCYHQANVVVVAVGGGLAYGALGMSHHATEDLAIMRSLPQMAVVAPGDPAETVAATNALSKGIGPAYLRLGRAGEPIIHHNKPSWELGKALCVRDGNDMTLISTGAMLSTAMTAADQLAETEGLDVRVLSMHTLKPIDEDAILFAAKETGALVTLEEHSILGGLGGAVAEVLCESEIGSVQFQRLGLPSSFISEVGSQEYLRKAVGLDVESVKQSLQWFLQRSRPRALSARAA